MIKKSYTIVVLIIFSLIDPAFVHSQDSVEDSILRKQSYEEFLQAVKKELTAHLPSNTNTGIFIKDLNTGKRILSLNENINFNPASTNKLLTSACAMKELGSDFKYQTKIYFDGENKNGEFTGNIIIRGSGDPTFSYYYYDDPFIVFYKITDYLDSAGINSIRGNIIGDDNYFDNVYYGPGWAWDDIINPFSSQINGISFNDNAAEIEIRQGDEPGKSARVDIFPGSKYINVINNVMTVDKEIPEHIEAERELKSNIVELYGTFRYDSLNPDRQEKISVSVDNPTRFFLSILENFLEMNQIRFRGALLDIDDWIGSIDYELIDPVIEIDSPPLIEILKRVNKESHNLSAESVLKTIGSELGGSGSFEKSVVFLNRYLAKAGIDTSMVVVVDGSGLSRYNLISPYIQSQLLENIYKEKFFDKFLSTMAKPGEKGTLENRMSKKKFKKNIFAKTGTMNNVSNICGYYIPQNGHCIVFSIMMNGFTEPVSKIMDIQDKIIIELTKLCK